MDSSVAVGWTAVVEAGFAGVDVEKGMGEEGSGAGWQALLKIKRSKVKALIVWHWSKERNFFIDCLPRYILPTYSER